MGNLAERREPDGTYRPELLFQIRGKRVLLAGKTPQHHFRY
jgi:hypothetical protein